MLSPEPALTRQTIIDLSYLSPSYLGIQLAGGHIGLPILVILFLSSRRIQRPATVINFCITWIIYSVSYSLTVYKAPHHSAHSPFELCLVQASMIHGAPAMAAVAGLEVVLQAWSTFMLPWQQLPGWVFRLPRWLVILLIVSPPYVVFLVFSIAAAFVALRHPETISTQSSLHCTIVSDTLAFQRFAVPTFCAVVMSAIVVMEVIMIVQYYRGWLRVRKVCPLATRKPSLSPWFRVTVFTVYSLAALGTCITYLFEYIGPLPYMVQAALPLVATLVFGSQSDILHVCSLGKFKKKSADNEVEYTPGGGWSAPTSAEISPQLRGHVSLASEASTGFRADQVPVSTADWHSAA